MFSKINLFSLAFMLFISELCPAYFDMSSGAKHKDSMNDISLADHPDFAQSWHLVTVRYREDSGELRFTYANDIAWKAIGKLNGPYPDGSIFGKVGIKTEADPSFVSSKVPAGAKRFQLMVKNSVKYKDTDGWGYALFDENGYIFDEDAKSTTQSCVACHRIVPQSDFVFSRPALLGLGNKKLSVVSVEDRTRHFEFFKTGASKIPGSIKSELPPGVSVAFSLGGDIQKHAFSGTFDEVIPLLEEQCKGTHAPAYLHVDDKHFSMVAEKKDDKACPEGGAGFRVLIVFNGRKVRDSQHCSRN